MSDFKKVIAIDFDGTLCENKWPEIGEPKWPVIWQAQKEQKNGALLILWTCREGKALQDAIIICKSWGLEFDAVNKNASELVDLYKNDSRKIGATEYWDDKAITPDMIEARWTGNGKLTRQKLSRLKR